MLRDSAQEQLADAYARAVNVQSLDIGEQLLILPSVSSMDLHAFIAYLDTYSL